MAPMMKACPALAHHPYKPPMSTGTTLIGVEFADGVVLGADSRTSAGSYITSRVTNKLTPITDKIFVCRSGSAADTQALADIVRYQLASYEMVYGAKPGVEIASEKFRELGYDYREDLTTSFLVAGYDEEKGGQIYAIPIGGMVTRRRMAASGSGSTFVSGFLNSAFKADMGRDEAVAFVLKAVTLATISDGSSGGICRINVVTKDGVENKVFLPNEMPKFSFEEYSSLKSEAVPAK